MSEEGFPYLDYMFAGIVANVPLWITTLIIDAMDTRPTVILLILVVVTLIGGAIGGYLVRARLSKPYRYASLITGVLAFFVSALFIENLFTDLTDFVLLPAFVVGAYVGIRVEERYPARAREIGVKPKPAEEAGQSPQVGGPA